MSLTQRQKKLLALIIEHFIDTGEPVGSKFLTTVFGSSISSATIRNEMANLTKIGFIDQPHTSAGRIPSGAGYRYYVEYLMPKISLTAADKYAIKAKLDLEQCEPSLFLKNACLLLSEITNCIAVASTPISELNVCSRIELVTLGTSSAMIIIKTDSGVVKSKVCRIDGEFDIEIIQLFYNLTKNYFTDKTPNSIPAINLQNLITALGDKLLIMLPLLTSLDELINECKIPQIITTGHENIFHHRALTPYSHDILNLLSNQDAVLKILSNAQDGISVQIGQDNGIYELLHAGIVTSRYNLSENISGTLAIIGPMGMDYSKYIPYIKYVTDTVTQTLKANL